MGVDEETFLHHLETLNIDTDNVSFAWLLDEDNEILNWFCENVSTNNCLTPDDRLKFSKLEEAGKVLSEAELKQELNNISEKYPGIALPNDSNGLCDARQKIKDSQEWIHLMESQKEVKTKLIEEDEIINQELSKKQFELNEKLSIENTILSKLTKECSELAIQAREQKLQCYTLMEDILKLCAASKNVEDKLFFSQMPLEEYFAKTELLVTYLKYNVSRQLEYLCEEGREDQASEIPDGFNEDTKLAESKLKENCDKMKEGLWIYVKTKAELRGIEEQLKFIQNYDVESCYDTRFEKVKMAGMVKILEGDTETFLQEKIPDAIQQFVDRQSQQILLSEVQLKHEKAKYIYDKLCSVVDLSQEAVNESGVALMCLRRDQLAADNLLQFAIDMISCLHNEISAKRFRELIPRPPNSMSFLLKSLYSFFGMDESLPPADLSRTIERFNNEIRDLEKAVFYDKFAKIEANIKNSKLATIPLRQLIWDGPTDQPCIRNEALDNALYELKKSNEESDVKIKHITKVYMEFKDFTEKEPILYNLWKWFLTDPSKIRIIREEYNSRERRPTKPFKTQQYCEKVKNVDTF